MIQDAIALITQRKNLTRGQAAETLHEIMTGQATLAQIGAFLAALSMKGETVDEITGLAETMRAEATKVVTARRPLVDTCGTGGDHSGTFNISTAAAFVAAGAGVAVAKHGNRSATSKCGSADVLEALGVNINAGPELVGRCIDEVGIGFLFARALHGAMKHVAGPRQEIRIRTIFNILGPLTNPAGACGQVVGVPTAALVEPVARVLQNLGARHAIVAHGSDGLDEITLTGSTQVVEAKGGTLERREVDPREFGLELCPPEALRGGDPTENAEIMKRIFQGEPGPKRDIVVLNAAAAIVVGEKAGSWAAGVEAARAAIDSGAALAKLEALVEVSNDSR